MPGIGDERGGVDAPADDQLVAGHGQVAEDADDGPGDARADVCGVAVPDELADALVTGGGGAGPDDHRDPDSGQVLGPLQAVGVTLGGRPPRQPETEEHHRAGGDVGQVMDRIAEQPNRAGQHRQQQLDQPCGAQADRADRHRPVGRPPVPGVITDIREGKGCCGITLPRCLVHRARMTSGAVPGQIWFVPA